MTTRAGGHVAIYPMLAKARRKEWPANVIDMLKVKYRVQDVIDYSGLEADGLYLEGTGAMVLDHVDRVAYAAKSKRTDPIALDAAQIGDFAGNAIELQGQQGLILAISARALKALRSEQIEVIERSAEILPLDIPCIELSGGSVRCTLAGIHLSAR